MNKVFIISGPNKGESYSINEDITTIGRSSDNDIRILGKGASRHHAKFIKRGEDLFIVDLNSLQGVFINGDKIEPGVEYKLNQDSTLILANAELSFNKHSSLKSDAQTCYTDKQDNSFINADKSLKDNFRDYIRYLEVLLEVSNIFAQSLDIRGLLGLVIDKIFGFLKRIDRVAILLLSEETGELEEAISKTRMDDKFGISSQINYSRSIVRRTINHGKPIMISDASRADKVDLSDSMKQMNIMSVMCVPLIYKGNVRGAVYVDSIGVPERFRKDDLQLLAGLGNIAAVYIENARLYEELKQKLSERKQAEDEKKKLETQFQYAQKIEAIGTLASGIAHNFNNILMGIQGNVSMMLLNTDFAEKNYKRLRTIEKSVQIASRLTSQLLGYAREGAYEIKPINLNQLLREISDTFAMTKKEIRLYLDLDQDLFMVRGDQGQIKQVLLNLYVNAADAMPGGGELFIKTERVTDEDIAGKGYDISHGEYVLLTVTDTGIGMDKHTMKRIFDPFFTTKGIGKGTGLGLASAYGIIKAHGGYIDFHSEMGHGTSFYIYLPKSEIKIPKIEEFPEKILKGRETILLVDDEDIIIEISQEMLEELGYKVLAARGGGEAIDIFKKSNNRIDIVILDMIMPDMGGGETYDQIKRINPDTKVLLSSGYSIDGQATEIMERGCDGFIQKPFSLEELSKALRGILDK
ncbi:MAG TPA: response regulator [Desulfatiglandales bacterium]|nr:response regulator [Desulfatiglandales bacterium]